MMRPKNREKYPSRSSQYVGVSILLGVLSLLICLFVLFISGRISSLFTIFQFPRETSPLVRDLQKLALKPLWQYDAGSNIRRIVGLAGNGLILYTQKNQFVALDVASGQRVWLYQAPGEITDLVTEDEFNLKDGLLVFTSFIGTSVQRKLIVLEAKTGQELWSLEDGPPQGYAVTTFAVGDQYIYWALRPHYLAFDRYTGEVVWQSELNTGPGGYHGLLYDGYDLIVVRPDMYVLDANTGNIKRRLTVHINSTPYKIHDGIIYVEKDESNLVKALDIKNDTVVWEQSLNIASDVSWSPLLREDRLYVRLNGLLGALAAPTGEPIWPQSEIHQNEAILYSNPVFVDDRIYTIFSDGSLRALNIANGLEIGQVDFKVAHDDAALYATDDRLFVSMGGTRLYAFTFY